MVIHFASAFHFLMFMLRWLRTNPSGNYARALALGTEVRQLPPHMYQAWFGHLSSFDENPPPELTPPLNAGALWVSARVMT